MDVDGVNAGDGDADVECGSGTVSCMGDVISVDARCGCAARAGIGAMGVGLGVCIGGRDGDRWDCSSKLGIAGSARS